MYTPTNAEMLRKRGLPTDYKFDVSFKKKADREKLPAFTCPDCTAVSLL